MRRTEAELIGDLISGLRQLPIRLQAMQVANPDALGALGVGMMSGNTSRESLASGFAGLMNANQQYRQQMLERQKAEADAARQQAQMTATAAFLKARGADPSLIQMAQSGAGKDAFDMWSKTQPVAPTPTDDMREYEFAKGQGFQGTLSDWILQQRKAGAQTTNIDMKGEGEYSKAVGKAYGEKFVGLQDASAKAQGVVDTLSVMEKAMEDPGFYSGAGGDAVLQLRRAGSAMGLDPAGISSVETFNGLAKQAALDAMGGSLGTGFSNADRDFVIQQVPNLGNTPQGNAALIRVQRKIAQRKVQIARLAREYAARNGGRIDYGFDDEVARWAAQNPLFDGSEIAGGVQQPANPSSPGVDDLIRKYGGNGGT